jgi:hypothetical protein
MKPKKQYFQFPRQLLDSPVMEALKTPDWLVLLRILREHQRKSGFQNSGLIITRRDFEMMTNARYVSQSIRVLTNLGIIKNTRGMGSSRTGRTPNMWLITFLPTTPTADDATHDYLAHKTIEEAKAIADTARQHEEITKTRKPPKKPKLAAVAAPPISPVSDN